MKAFITDTTYRLIDGKSYVYLFGRLENGESFLTINEYKPYFYIKRSDAPKAKGIAPSEQETTRLKTMEGAPVTKVTVAMPKDVPVLRRAFEDNGIPCFEADMRFTQRFLMDHDIKMTMDVHGVHKKGEYVNRIYEEPTLTSVEYNPQVSVLSIDIETSFDAKSLYAVSLVQQDVNSEERATTLFLNENDNEVHEKATLKGVERFDDEKTLLERLTAIFKAWDPDVITGWNVIDFDFAFLKARFDKASVPFVLGRTDWPCRLRLESDFIRDSKAEFPGRQVLDGIHLLKSSFIRLNDYKLETAARSLVGKGKLLQGPSRHEEIERLYHEEPKALIEYNLQDAKLVLDILEKQQLIPLTIKRSTLTGLTLDRVRASIASFDSVYIRALHAEGVVAPTLKPVARGERITGGFVREPKPGVYDTILVLDFKSMYPSIIRTFNIDPARYQPNCKEEESTAKVVVAPNGACFEKRAGLLPRIIQELWLERDAAKKRKDGVASLALKTLMNSFFGVFASPNCRFYSLAIGNAITSFARHFIKLTAERIEAKGYDVIYGDTDSVFVKTGAVSVAEAEKLGDDLQRDINEYYASYVRDVYGVKNFMELEAEKVYRKFLLPKLRGKEGGAKKRYAGLLVKDGEEVLDFTGLEFVRRDWTELAKQFQMELLNKIFHEEEVTAYVKGFVEDVKKGLHDELLVYKKSLRKGLDEYTKTTPPHVKAARILDAKGLLEGNVISYVITSNGPEPVGHETSPINYDHYIEKQVKPLADSILGFYGTTFDDLVTGSSQQTLFKY